MPEQRSETAQRIINEAAKVVIHVSSMEENLENISYWENTLLSDVHSVDVTSLRQDDIKDIQSSLRSLGSMLEKYPGQQEFRNQILKYILKFASTRE